MKGFKKCVSIMLAMGLLVSTNTGYVKADENNVKYSFNNGVLTVEGNGVADQKYTNVCKKDDIKKIVIKSGVTQVMPYTFSCKNLETVDIANTVTKIGLSAFSSEKSIKKVTMPGTFSTVIPDYEGDELVDKIFSSKVKELKLTTGFNSKVKKYYLANKITIAKSDKNYKSYNGVVYTKNGKKLVLVPLNTKNINIRKGCTNVLTSSFAYSYNVEGEYEPYLQNIKSINIPKSVKKITDDLSYDTAIKTKKINIKTKKLSGYSYENLLNVISNKKLVLNKIKPKNKMYIKGSVLLSYKGKSKKVTIPKKIKRIAANSFNGKKITSVKLSKNLNSIGQFAFSRCKKLSKVTWNKKLKKIEDYAFYLTNLKKVNIPSSVKTWGDSCFSHCNATSIKFPKNMTRIPRGMFGGTKVKNLVIPGNIKTIEPYAFASGSSFETITLKDGVTKICHHAFDEGNHTKSVIIPNSVTSIEEYAFSETTIDKVEIANHNVAIDSSAFYDVAEMTIKAEPQNYFTLASLLSSDAQHNYEIHTIKISNAAGFEVAFSDTENFADSITFDLPNKSANHELKVGKNCKYYKIRPYSTVDGKKVYGKWSNFN